ncbi:L,D-transpeptidase family protein [Histidinibacterium lentulum]|uniref:Murein L,D-transpeptidase n=1 Tax=Histidinibacterium lentulum TaxID=2480588 RepID=A0A3N2R9D3_9RHOB|nr:L,D-transpeptidase family protein [Histidinibacterium lentulum]ROU04090.1 murein L,D-transpeptidase [Histidinibacterium lentulum]
MSWDAKSFRRGLAAVAVALLVTGAGAPRAEANLLVSLYAQGVAEAAARRDDLAAFYRSRDFEGIWTGTDEASELRRMAFIAALGDAPMHGLPASRFNPERAMGILAGATTADSRGRAEVELTAYFLAYARALNTGLIAPSSIDANFKREVQRLPTQVILARFLENPRALLHSLPPSSPEYQRLMRAKVRLSEVIATGGYGPGVQGPLGLGDSGAQVVRLRDRLIAMDLLEPTLTATFDGTILDAVRRFQESVALEPDGVVGGATVTMLNMSAEDRLESVLVAMERERWLNNLERGDRHVWVNLTDFSAQIRDFDSVTFETRAVIGAGQFDKQTYEFSDEMEYMELNPYWYVPRSIINRDYGGRVPSGFQAIDSRGRIVQTSSAQNVSVRQPPGPNNALGTVKFMFPNPHAIYLHDTPARSLFSRVVRAYSSGCIRLHEPHEFAYVLLERQVEDPESYFQGILRTRQNSRITLDEPVPVHLVYRTAFTSPDGQLHFRNDIYNRDARIWAELERLGVAITAPTG